MGATKRTKRERFYELLVKTPGLSFPGPSTTGAAEFSNACKTVFGGSARPSMTKAEIEDNICEFLNECENHFHKFTMCPTHDISTPPCECPERSVEYYGYIASSLQESWGRPIDPENIKSIVEATLYARIEVIQKNGGVQNDIKGAKNLILLNAHILLCNFAAYKNSHSYDPVQGLCWTVGGALDSQQEATKRKETLVAKQREAKNKRLESGAGAENPSAADSAATEEM
ncbi:hypothetical protein F52700_1774 [Fusarium sp. NRRL 52700]|nr:hypothetical protein F52700_1774 [Fusarium sp. NRRL 52700]